MKFINHCFADYYYLLENGTVYNKNTNQIIQPDKNHMFILKTSQNYKKKISLKTLYNIVYHKPFSIDNIEDLKNEEWKEINSTNGFYYISNKGRIKSLYGYNVILLKPFSNKEGYERVDIVENGNRRTVLVHRLVAQHFLPFPQNIDMQLHHKDFDKKNNSVNNLQWLTASEHKKKHNERNKIKNVSA